jgi:CheY-like chemotaxis protein
LQGHGELILVVDDEPLILLTAKATLESNGYQVLTANNGQVAVEIFRDKHPEIAAVLLDIMMPVLDGPETMKAMKSIDPSVKIIAASGLRLAERPAAESAAGFLKKPYSDCELLKMLSEFFQHP